MSGLLFSAAQRIERTAGARAALHAYRALAGRGASADSALAHLAALRCAAELDDGESFTHVLTTWPTQRGAALESAPALAKRLAQSGKPQLARELIDAERRRWNERERATPAAAVTLYLAAALARSTTEKRALYTQLREHPSPLGDKATLRLAELALADGETAQAAALAATIDKRRLQDGERVRHAELSLLSGSRFQRAEGFAELAERVASSPNDVIVRAIRALVARLPALSTLERDRLRAVFSRIPDEARRARFVDFCDQLLAFGESSELEETAPGSDGAKSALELRWMHVTLRDLEKRLADPSEHERPLLETRLSALVKAGAVPRRGFAPLVFLVQNGALQRDLAIRADAAREPRGRATLLALVHRAADRALAAGDPRRAFALVDAACRVAEGGDSHALYTILTERPG